MDLKRLQELPPWEWPQNAGTIFHRILTQEGAPAADRLIAAKLAGDFTVINDKLADTLLEIIGRTGEPDELRAAAAISLGPALDAGSTYGFDDPDDVPITLHMYVKLQHTLHQLYLDQSIPKPVRRRILEASVRAPEDWHKDAISAAYASKDKEWVLTAVFGMAYIPGFEPQILESLKSADIETQCEAVSAAGNFEIDAAWNHIIGLIDNPRTPKNLLLAAIEAVASIRPREAGRVLAGVVDSDDEEVAEAADEALTMSSVGSGGDFDEFDDEDDEDPEDGHGWVN